MVNANLSELPNWIEDCKGQQLEAIWVGIRRNDGFNFTQSKELFFSILRRLIREGQLLVDTRVDARSLPWGSEQPEIIAWLEMHFPNEIAADEGLWFIDNLERPDGQYPGACVWRAAALNGEDIWA
ncbi:hypothetical protein [Silvimonas iriomotensis]|uniref:DUF596 domain-containing protein n=1 Tax=Silvimonas iriomotensis TaxID=449662 RepID=A0ABQ2PAM3_9NEIS|nr:hypothetical protein [Silvimonas iriomotensis]GGP22036.1 hypothetical protein GCM10010970_23040 [Silvimonas iriomotensis]